MTTTSTPASCSWCCRKDSRTMRLILFRAVACRQLFLEIANPSRATPPLLSLQSTVNHLSRLRVACLNTRPKAAALSSRFSLRNRYIELRACGACLSAVVMTAFWQSGYGVSLARPLARRRLRTRRPAFVAIRARNPWLRARLILLGWYVRFIGLYPAARSAAAIPRSGGRQGYADGPGVSIDSPFGG